MPAPAQEVAQSVLETFENIGVNTDLNIQRGESGEDVEQQVVDPERSEDRTRGKITNRGRTNDKKEPEVDSREAVLRDECTCKDVDVLEAEEEDLDIEIPLIEKEEFCDPEDEDDDDDGGDKNEDDDEEEDVEDYIESPLLQMQRDDQNQVLSKADRMKAKEMAKKLKRKAIIQERKPCKQERLSCFHFDREHWKTPPVWTEGTICACLNTMNNSYYCIRTINATHNFIYCEYVTNFKEYFDMRIGADPHQLVNLASSLGPVSRAELHDQVDELRTCRGKRCSPSSKRRKGSRKNASPDCALQSAPCGGRNSSLGSTLAIKEGSRFVVAFQKNLDHFYQSNPGSFKISLSFDEEKTFQLLQYLPDTSAPSLTLYYMNVTMPNAPLNKPGTMRVAYVTQNPQAPADFYQCSDIMLYK